MEEHTVVSLPKPASGVTDDPLLAVLREGARRMLMQAIEAEVEAFLTAHAGLADEGARRRLVRNGHAPERQIQSKRRLSLAITHNSAGPNELAAAESVMIP